MKKCPKCGTEFEGNCCPECGTKVVLVKTCPACGAKVKAEAKFCNECGYSFEKRETPKAQAAQPPKPKEKVSVIAWIKSHLKIVVPVAIALVLAIILAIAIPTCIAAKDNGTYYKLGYNGELDKKTYFKINSGKWSDEDGESGTYKKDGEKITFYMSFMGETEEMCDGTVKDGVLKVKSVFGEDIYVSDKHKHKYGEWKTTIEVTCTTDGEQTRTCACGVKETREILATGTLGLKYALNYNKTAYTLTGIGTATDTDVAIPKFYSGLPVTSIGEDAFYNCSGLTSVTIGDGVTAIGRYAFYGCRSLTSITIPDGVTSIGSEAFSDCSGLKSIYYQGDIASWCGIEGIRYLTSSNRTLYIDGKELTDELVIPDGITKINDYAFRGCSKLTGVTIGNGVTSIGEGAFEYCSSLTSITIPDSVTSIGSSAFSQCTSLTSITYNGTKAKWKAIKKSSSWNEYSDDFTITCTDGKLDRDGYEITE